MNGGDLLALGPLIALGLTAVVVMLAAAFCRNHRLAVALTLAGLTAAGVALVCAWPLTPRQVTPLLLIDRPALFYTGLMLAAALVVTLLSHGYLEQQPIGRREEYYVLVLTTTLGAGVLAASAHFASFFLGLELLSVSLFALVAYPRTNPLCIEAGIKYLVLAGTSSAFLLFGVGLVYAALGTLDFARLAAAAAGGAAPGLLILAGVSLTLVGIGFKLSLVPFHLWAPDVYQGAPAPVAALVATVSKGAVFALLLRYVGQLPVSQHAALFTMFTVLAIASMFIGNWLALLQQNVKRLLAYSSIAHMGYLLVALLAGGRWAPAAVAVYLTAYFVTTLGAFGVVAVLSPRGRDADAPEDILGLAWRRPWLAGVFTLMLLSLAGIPLTAGFVGKFFVLAAGVNSNLWLLAAALAVNSAIGLFYYLRLIVLLFRQPAPAPAATPPLPRLAAAALGALTLALLWLGVYPAPFLQLIRMLMPD
ncbi:MAG: NADH-quinone oxidoreductase subunit N [Kiritimatiellaeota bacterium]|nr:NADH-quinone oxidoreductase subunit N [Kiritimatiellota bacterium]